MYVSINIARKTGASDFQNVVYTFCLFLLRVSSSLPNVVAKDELVYVIDVGEVFTSEANAGDFYVSVFSRSLAAP